jgi:hypothetical protein
LTARGAKAERKDESSINRARRLRVVRATGARDMAAIQLRPGRAVLARRRAAATLNACLQPLGLAVIPAAGLTEAQRLAGRSRGDGDGVDARDRRELTPTKPAPVGAFPPLPGRRSRGRA